MKKHKHKPTYQDMVADLKRYWSEHGCIVLEPYDMPMGAGTFHPASFLYALGDKPWRCVYVQGCRRPSDGRYGDNPNRLQHYYQMQVLMKPPPENLQELYLGSLTMLGIKPLMHDIRFVEDNWESPTLGAWGLGWEVRVDGMEVSQFTYFQQVGGIACPIVSGEVTYGLERMAMFLQQCDSVYDLVWNEGGGTTVRYGDIYHRNETEQSAFNFDYADTGTLFKRFDEIETECHALLKAGLPLPAYDQLIMASHVFNLLVSRRAVSVTERQSYVLRTRRMATTIARLYTGQTAASDGHEAKTI